MFMVHGGVKSENFDYNFHNESVFYVEQRRSHRQNITPHHARYLSPSALWTHSLSLPDAPYLRFQSVISLCPRNHLISPKLFDCSPLPFSPSTSILSASFHPTTHQAHSTDLLLFLAAVLCLLLPHLLSAHLLKHQFFWSFLLPHALVIPPGRVVSLCRFWHTPSRVGVFSVLPPFLNLLVHAAETSINHI